MADLSPFEATTSVAPRLPGPSAREVFLVLTLVAAVVVLLVAGRNDVGNPVDQWVTIVAADAYAQWFLDKRPSDPNERREWANNIWKYNCEHPPVAKIAMGLTARATAKMLGRPGAYRLASILFFAGLAIGLYFTARRRWGVTAGLAALLMLIASPRLVGHALIAVLDLPMAVMCFMAAMAFLGALRGGWRAGWFGIALGLALATKINALLLPFALAGWAALYRRRDHAAAMTAMVFLALPTLVAVWPWLWHDTIGRFADYIAFFGRQSRVPTYYFGHVYRDPPAPWHYPFVVTAITLPLPVVLLTVVGIARLARDRFRDHFGGFLLVNALVPLLAIARPGQAKYDGERTFLNVFPFLFLLAALGFAWLVHEAQAWLGRRLETTRHAMIRRLHLAVPAFALVLVFAPLLVQVLLQHPYELNFYGGLTGGMRGALRRGFDSTSWGAHPVNPEVVRWVNEHLPYGATIDSNAGAFGTLLYYQRNGQLRQDIQFEPNARYWVLECQQGYFSGPWLWDNYYDRNPQYKRIHTFSKNGVPLVLVLERQGAG